MNEKTLQQQQRNDKKHRKLIRSPEKLSPCDLDPSFNPSFLSTASNFFGISCQSNNKSSPTKNYNDQFPPCHKLPTSSDPSTASCSSSLPPSSSSPTIALHRKPSITIKYSSVEKKPTETLCGHLSSTSHNQHIVKVNDSSHSSLKTISTKENADQTSNNLFVNVNNAPGYFSQTINNLSPAKPLEQQQLQTQSRTSSPVDICKQTLQGQQPVMNHSPTSQSLNLCLLNSSNMVPNDSNIVDDRLPFTFNSNNPFLNDTFDSIISHEDEGGGNIDASFFNIEDTQQSDLLFLTDDTLLNQSEEIDEQLLKNKREKFSNASTMKICLVVSPPTNKLFQVSIEKSHHLSMVVKYSTHKIDGHLRKCAHE